MKAWLVNGKPEDKVSLDDRGLAYGDGLFETIALRNQRPRFLDLHLARLQAGCRRLGIPAPDSDLMTAEVDALIAGCTQGTIKILITRGTGPRGYRPPSAVTATRIVGVDRGERLCEGSRFDTATVMICRTPASINPLLAGMKTLNRLENVLACAEWQNTGNNEGLMLDPFGRVVGGTTSNLFIVSAGRLLTPSLEQFGVRGIMRTVVIQAAYESGVDTQETELSLADVQRADEMFLTNALIGLRPVIHCAGHTYGVGPVTRRLGETLRHRGVEECPF